MKNPYFLVEMFIMFLDCASWVLVLVPTLVSCKILTPQKAPGDDTSIYLRMLSDTRPSYFFKSNRNSRKRYFGRT